MTTHDYGPEAIRAVQVQYGREKRLKSMSEVPNAPTLVLEREETMVVKGFEGLLEHFQIDEPTYRAIVKKLALQFELDEQDFERAKNCYHYQRHHQDSIVKPVETPAWPPGCFQGSQRCLDCSRYQGLTDEQKKRAEGLCDIDTGEPLRHPDHTEC